MNEIVKAKIMQWVASTIGVILVVISLILSKNEIGYMYDGLMMNVSNENLLISAKYVVLAIVVIKTIIDIIKKPKMITDRLAAMALFVCVLEMIITGEYVFTIFAYTYNCIVFNLFSEGFMSKYIVKSRTKVNVN